MNDPGPVAPEFHDHPSVSDGGRVAVYARYSTRFQDSIEDQLRCCLEKAGSLGLAVGQGLIFADRGVSGRRDRRPGYQGLIQAIENGQVDTLIVMSTHRLHRKLHKALQFVAQYLEPRKIRFISETQGIDSHDNPDHWKAFVSFHGIFDELQLKAYVGHIRASHESLLLDGYVYGTVAFGYAGAEVEGQSTRKGTPRRKLAVDEEQANWVRTIYHWYLHDRMSINGIVHRLKGLGAPLPPRCTTGRWTYQAVGRLLSNPRYRGLFEYGKTESVWLDKQDYTRQVPLDEPRRAVQFEGLRIVDDETWYAVQALREQQARKPKHRNTKPARKAPPPVLNGLLKCGHCGRTLVSAGGYGERAHCPGCRREPEGLFTQVDKRLATRMICERLARVVRCDDRLIDEITQIFEEHAASIQRPDPQTLDRLGRGLAAVDRKIAFVLDAPGDTDADMDENRQRLKHLRGERAGLQAKQARLNALADESIRIPSRLEIEEALDGAAEVMVQAAEDTDIDDADRVRRIIELVTGGSLMVRQCGERKPGKGWVRITFDYHPALLCGVDQAEPVSRIEVEMRKRPPHEVIANRVMPFVEEGMAYNLIAERLGCSRGMVSKAVAHWHGSRGLTVPDGRSNKRQPTKPRIAETIVDTVMALIDEMPIKQIAERLGVGRNKVTEALKLGHERQGLSVPDGRALRKARNRRRRREAG